MIYTCIYTYTHMYIYIYICIYIYIHMYTFIYTHQMGALGHDTAAVWSDITKCCLRTVAVKFPHLWQTYHSIVLNEEGPSMGFQIIGVDIMFDHQLRPWLLETNNGPSFNMDQVLQHVAVSYSVLQHHVGPPAPALAS